MAEELGKIEKPQVENFRKGRRLFFVPLIFGNTELAEDFLKKFNLYWEQVAGQIADLVSKLGDVKRIYHEMIPESGEAGCKAISELNEKSYNIVQSCLDNKAQLEALEESDILTEFMDWNRCLLIGLQNPKVIAKVYNFYLEAGKKRNESIACRIDRTLQADEIGLLMMRENHQVQFPSDIQVFFISPPALDEIKRWLRTQESKTVEDKQDS